MTSTARCRDDLLLSGKSVVITGAARGLGRSYALDLASRGANVALNDMDAEKLAELEAEVQRRGGHSVSVGGSVVAPSTANRLVAECCGAFGGIDALINNAGIRPEGLSWDEDPQITRRAVEVNVLGTMFCGAAALRVMKEQGCGSIVNVSSRAQTGIERSATYSATKGAVASLTYSWALDAAPVRVNAIAPHARGTGTRRQGVPPRSEEPEPDAMAPLVAFLVSDLSRHITGQVIRLVGRPSGLGLGLMSHPRGGRLLLNDGWTVSQIEYAFESVLGAELEPVGADGRSVAYTDILGTAVRMQGR